jgi:hypothetical protein
VKAITLHCKSYAFTKKRVQNAVLGRPLTAFYASFSPRLRFFVDKNKKAK